ncbi:hypothetical protein EXIGLDRAFT_350217 [Exidia glandulosa HHB12029]|uniref:Uncharacterized protein n=1 Tax=Exidia glandulosa HHB12029 TaxID=1314781 RepID=A0A165CDE4_EXIGL|nr:hypothetical protein EXIGLDRAFT_350217 [Exidia glandulosa HHB12029]
MTRRSYEVVSLMMLHPTSTLCFSVMFLSLMGWQYRLPLVLCSFIGRGRRRALEITWTQCSWAQPMMRGFPRRGNAHTNASESGRPCVPQLLAENLYRQRCPIDWPKFRPWVMVRQSVVGQSAAYFCRQPRELVVLYAPTQGSSDTMLSCDSASCCFWGAISAV